MQLHRSIPMLLFAMGCVFGSGMAPAIAGASNSNIPRSGAATEALMAQDADGLLAAINAERAMSGLSVLQDDSELCQLAKLRSDDQVTRHYFSHVSPDGGTVFSLLDLAGVNWTVAGENLAETSAPDPTQSVLNGFMQSPEHRANVLDPGYGHIGTGAAMADDGEVILTVVFTN